MKKINLKHISYAVLLTLLLFPTLFLPMLQISIDSLKRNETSLKSSAAGVSHYTVGHNVTYEVVVNFSLTNNRIVADTFYLKWSRIDDRQPNASLTPFCPPYQKTQLLYNSINSDDPGDLTVNWGHVDRFNNTFDNVTVILAQDETMTIAQKYIMNLNEIYFSGITDPDIGAYNPSDDIHALYNVTEQFYECNDIELIYLSNYLVDPADNVIEKAQKIITWVSTKLQYEVQTETAYGGEKGADWANTTGRGDCSEYSDLMITLLRIQGIPARKMNGDVITNNPVTQPIVGSTWTYTNTGDEASSSSNFFGHAWVEYYVPNIGWIACDPTWHGIYNYFNRIDAFHLVYNNGAWFDLPGSAPDANEFGNPGLVYGAGSDFDFEYQVTITVIASDYTPFDWGFLITIAIILGVVALVALVIYIVIKKTR